MFKELLASLSLFISTLLNQPDVVQNTQQTTQPTTQQVEKVDSFYRYTSPTTIVGKVYVGNYKNIHTANAIREYSVQNVSFDTGKCIVVSQTPSEATVLDANGYFSFSLTFADQCPIDTIYVSGELLVKNEVIANGQTFSNQSVITFGPKKVVNQNPIRLGNIDFVIESEPKIYTNTQTQVRFLLKDLDSKIQIDSEDVQEIKIKSSDATMLRIVTKDGSVGELTLQNVADGVITLETLGKDGEASLILTAKIVNKEGFVQTISKVVPFNIVYKPQTYLIEVENADQAILLGNMSRISIKVVGSEDLRPLGAEKIARVTLKTLNQNAKIADIYGNLYDEMSKEEIFTESVDFLVKGLELGNSEFEVSVDLKGIPNQNRVIKKISYPVVKRLNNTITLEYAGTDYNETSGFFIDSYTLKLRSSKFDGNKITITILNPKIDTNWYYQQGNFFTFNSFEENPYVYLDGFRNQQFSGTLERVGEDSLKFSSKLFDLSRVDTSKDKLIVIPNGIRQDPNYLGGWKISSIIDNDEILLQGSMDEERVDNLTFVIGSESRWDPKRETISNIMLDKPDGIYTIENRQVQFQIIYPKFFGGKDIFINASIGSGKVRLGNSFKRTLTGTELSMPDTIVCKKAAMCAFNVQIAYPAANYGLSFSNFGVQCNVDKVYYYYFTPTNTSCASRTSLQYGSGRSLKKTDGWGFVKLCVYPAAIYEEKTDEETGQIYYLFKGYDEGTVTCENPRVAVEFPY